MRISIIATGLALALAPGVARAQAPILGSEPVPPPPDGGVSVRLELGRLVRRDERASPVTYSGPTWRGGIAWVRPGRLRARVSLAGGAGTLTSSLTDAGRPSDSVYDGRLSVSLATPVPRLRGPRGELRVGAASSLEGWYAIHAYADPNRTQHAYGTALLTLGPAIGGGFGVGAGAIDLALTVPVVGVASHPYSDVRVAEPGRMALDVLTAGGVLEGLRGRVAYLRPARWGGYGLAYGLEAGALRSEAELAYVRHSLSFQATFGR